jgi:hypothetical protein
MAKATVWHTPYLSLEGIKWVDLGGNTKYTKGNMNRCNVKLYGGIHKTKVGLEVLRVSKCQNSFDARYEISFYFFNSKNNTLWRKENI